MGETREDKSSDDYIERSRKFSQQEKQRLEDELKKIAEKEQQQKSADTEKR